MWYNLRLAIAAFFMALAHHAAPKDIKAHIEECMDDIEDHYK